MPKVTILCGESPLPVCQALKTLEATEVVIIHGQGGSKNVADRARDYCRDTLKIAESKVQLVEVDAFNPLRCHQTMWDIRPLLASSTLVYGPGTSAMNAMIHEVWRYAGGNEFQQGQSWYIQANPSQLLPSNSDLLEKNDNGNVVDSEKQKKVVATGLDSEGLINLHLLQEFTLGALENIEPFANWKEDKFKKAIADIGQGVRNILYNGAKRAANLSAEGSEWLKNFDPELRDGFFMEAVIYHVLKQGFDRDQIIHSVEVLDKHENSVLEMDVLLRKGDNHLWISSHTNSANNKWDKSLKTIEKNSPYTEFRKKFFEAKENAVRLSGKEARSITIVNRSIKSIPRSETVKIPYTFEDRIKNGRKLRRKLSLLRTDNEGKEKDYTIADRHIIIDLAELLGKDPVGTVSNTPKHLKGCATPELSEWIDNALNH